MTSDPPLTGDATPIGAHTMSPAMREMSAYCRYLFRQVEPALGQRVWEIGVGYGTYTALLRASGRSVLATDIDADCLKAVAERFATDTSVVTARVDLTDEGTVRDQAAFRADSIMCLNVLEHIQDDVAALRWLRETVQLRSGLGLIVPAHPYLYGQMDSEAGHFRRYTRASLQRVLQDAGWIAERVRYINLVGALGWWYHNRVRRNAGLQDASVNRQMVQIDRWLPRLARCTDPCCGFIGGLSVLAIARAGVKC